MNMTLYYFAFEITILNTVLHYYKQFHMKRLEVPEAVYRRMIDNAILKITQDKKKKEVRNHFTTKNANNINKAWPCYKTNGRKDETNKWKST